MKSHICILLMLLSVFSLSAQDYASLHDKLIRFYGYQRSGLKSGSSGNLNGQNIHGGDNYKNNPLDGGWNDAGDYIKFGMPLSYVVYCLLKGYDIFPSAYADSYKADNSAGADGIPDILNQVKYATDYIQKAVIDANTIVLDVGLAQEEHQSMGVVNPDGRSESKILLCDGGDIPAVYAADLALMSVLYKKFDTAYSTQCLAKAKVAFAFAKSHIDSKKLYCTPQLKNGTALYDYYDAGDGKGKITRIDDKMVAAGIELFRATNDGDPIYKTWAKKSMPPYFNCLTYSFIGPLASFEVWRQGLGDPTSVMDNAGFVGTKIQPTGFFTGVYQNSGWGTARDVGTAAFVFSLAYVVTSTQNQRDTLLNRAKNHVQWVIGNFGKTKRNYVVKWGTGGPTNIHYRPTSTGPEGGVVTGPDGDGNWSDNGDAKYCEVACDYNAGIVGAVAFLKAVGSTGGTDIRMSSAFTATPMTSVDFTSKPVTFSATFSKSVACTIKISGGFGSKTITKSGTSLSETWDGSADKGFFISGDSVAAQLIMDGTIAAIDIVKAKALTISITKAMKLGKNANDVPIDDFEDGDKINKLGGQWLGCGSDEGSFSGATVLAFDTMNASKVIKATCNISSDNPAVYAGIKSTLKADGSPTSIGGAQSIFFDMKGSKAANVRVELVQPSITDTAYWGIEVPVTTLPNTYRVTIADFRQPSWKTVDKALDRNNITAFRFVVYDSTSLINLYIDNVFVESFKSAVAASARTPVPSSFRPVFTNGALHYRFPAFIGSSVDLTVCDIVGRIIMRRSINATAGDAAVISLSQLPAGTFTVEHSINGKSAGQKMKITLVR
jgi:endoglucanase